MATDPEYGWLAYPLENTRIGFAHAASLDETDWLNLIAGATPSGFDSIYILLDVKDGLTSRAADCRLENMARLKHATGGKQRLPKNLCADSGALFTQRRS